MISSLCRVPTSGRGCCADCFWSSRWGARPPLPAPPGSSSRMAASSPGDLVGYSGGIYTLRSPTLGEVRLEESKVRSVRPGAAGDPAGADAAGGLGGLRLPPDLAGQVQATQQRLISDPAVFGMIMALQSDPAIRAVLSDPAFLSLITSGNLQAIQGNPKVSGTPAAPGAEGHPGAGPLACPSGRRGLAAARQDAPDRGTKPHSCTSDWQSIAASCGV